MKTFLLLLVALALAPATASARMPMPGPPVRVVHAQGPCSADASECVDEDGTIYMRGRDRFTRAHARGHVFDQRVLTDSDRAWFTHLFGFADGTPWQAGDVRVSPISAGPIEYFADAYAACDVHQIAGPRRVHGALVIDWKSSTGYMPTRRQQRRACIAIAVLAAVADAR